MNLSNIFLLLITITTLYLLYYAITTKQDIQGTKFYTFLSLLAGSASFFIALTLYYQAKIQEDSDRDKLAQSTVEIIKDLWLNPNIFMADKYDDLKGFPQELYQDQVINNKSDMEQLSLAIKIFQTFEDYRTVYEQDQTGLEVWLGNFLQWVQSDKLKAIWKRMYHNYKSSTYRFTEFLFENGEKLKEMRKVKKAPLTPDDYLKLINQIKDQAHQILEN